MRYVILKSDNVKIGIDVKNWCVQNKKKEERRIILKGDRIDRLYD